MDGARAGVSLSDMTAKLRSMRSPTLPLFSGWNWHAITLPRCTELTYSSPYDVVVRAHGSSAAVRAARKEWTK